MAGFIKFKKENDGTSSIEYAIDYYMILFCMAIYACIVNDGSLNDIFFHAALLRD